MKNFHLGDILSVTTGILVSPRHMQGVYDVINYMTEKSNFTHELPHQSKSCTERILMQHPQLANIVYNGGDNWRGWLDRQIALFGEELPLTP